MDGKAIMVIAAVIRRAPEIVLELLAIDRCRHPQLDIESRRRGARRHQKIVSVEELDDAAEQGGALALGRGELARRLRAGRARCSR